MCDTVQKEEKSKKGEGESGSFRTDSGDTASPPFDESSVSDTSSVSTIGSYTIGEEHDCESLLHSVASIELGPEKTNFGKVMGSDLVNSAKSSSIESASDSPRKRVSFKEEIESVHSYENNAVVEKPGDAENAEKKLVEEHFEAKTVTEIFYKRVSRNKPRVKYSGGKTMEEVEETAELLFRARLGTRRKLKMGDVHAFVVGHLGDWQGLDPLRYRKHLAACCGTQAPAELTPYEVIVCYLDMNGLLEGKCLLWAGLKLGKAKKDVDEGFRGGGNVKDKDEKKSGHSNEDAKSETLSVVGTIVSKAAGVKERKTKEAARKEINLPHPCTDEYLTDLKKAYPEFTIKNDVKCAIAHNEAGNHRVLTRALLSKRAGVERGRRVIDVGGNVTHWAREKRTNVHCCAPLYETNDASRHTMNELHIKQWIEDNKVPAEFAEMWKTSEGRKLLICNKLSQECDLQADEGMSMHSCYEIPFDTMAEIMSAHQMIVLWCAWTWSPEMMLKDHGTLPGGGEYEVDRVADRISFSFLDDPSNGYSHCFSTMCDKQIRFSTKIEGKVYQWELMENRLGVQYARMICVGSPTIDMTMSATRLAWTSTFSEKYALVKLFSFGNRRGKQLGLGGVRDLEFTHVWMDRNMINSALAYAISKVMGAQRSAPATALELHRSVIADLFAYMVSTDSRVVINGVNVTKKDRTDAQVMYDVAGSILCCAIRSVVSAGVAASIQLAANAVDAALKKRGTPYLAVNAVYESVTSLWKGKNTAQNQKDADGTLQRVRKYLLECASDYDSRDLVSFADRSTRFDGYQTCLTLDVMKRMSRLTADRLKKSMDKEYWFKEEETTPFYRLLELKINANDGVFKELQWDMGRVGESVGDFIKRAQKIVECEPEVEEKEKKETERRRRIETLLKTKLPADKAEEILRENYSNEQWKLIFGTRFGLGSSGELILDEQRIVAGTVEDRSGAIALYMKSLMTRAGWTNPPGTNSMCGIFSLFDSLRRQLDGESGLATEDNFMKLGGTLYLKSVLNSLMSVDKIHTSEFDVVELVVVLRSLGVVRGCVAVLDKASQKDGKTRVVAWHTVECDPRVSDPLEVWLVLKAGHYYYWTGYDGARVCELEDARLLDNITPPVAWTYQRDLADELSSNRTLTAQMPLTGSAVQLILGTTMKVSEPNEPPEKFLERCEDVVSFVQTESQISDVSIKVQVNCIGGEPSLADVMQLFKDTCNHISVKTWLRDLRKDDVRLYSRRMLQLKHDELTKGDRWSRRREDLKRRLVKLKDRMPRTLVGLTILSEERMRVFKDEGFRGLRFKESQSVDAEIQNNKSRIPPLPVEESVEQSKAGLSEMFRLLDGRDGVDERRWYQKKRYWAAIAGFLTVGAILDDGKTVDELFRGGGRGRRRKPNSAENEPKDPVVEEKKEQENGWSVIVENLLKLLEERRTLMQSRGWQEMQKGAGLLEDSKKARLDSDDFLPEMLDKNAMLVKVEDEFDRLLNEQFVVEMKFGDKRKWRGLLEMVCEKKAIISEMTEVPESFLIEATNSLKRSIQALKHVVEVEKKPALVFETPKKSIMKCSYSSVESSPSRSSRVSSNASSPSRSSSTKLFGTDLEIEGMESEEDFSDVSFSDEPYFLSRTLVGISLTRDRKECVDSSDEVVVERRGGMLGKDAMHYANMGIRLAGKISTIELREDTKFPVASALEPTKVLKVAVEMDRIKSKMVGRCDVVSERYNVVAARGGKNGYVVSGLRSISKPSNVLGGDGVVSLGKEMTKWNVGENLWYASSGTPLFKKEPIRDKCDKISSYVKDRFSNLIASDFSELMKRTDEAALKRQEKEVPVLNDAVEARIANVMLVSLVRMNALRLAKNEELRRGTTCGQRFKLKKIEDELRNEYNVLRKWISKEFPITDPWRIKKLEEYSPVFGGFVRLVNLEGDVMQFLDVFSSESLNELKVKEEAFRDTRSILNSMFRPVLWIDDEIEVRSRQEVEAVVDVLCNETYDGVGNTGRLLEAVLVMSVWVYLQEGVSDCGPQAVRHWQTLIGSSPIVEKMGELYEEFTELCGLNKPILRREKVKEEKAVWWKQVADWLKKWSSKLMRMLLDLVIGIPTESFRIVLRSLVYGVWFLKHLMMSLIGVIWSVSQYMFGEKKKRIETSVSEDLKEVKGAQQRKTLMTEKLPMTVVLSCGVACGLVLKNRRFLVTKLKELKRNDSLLEWTWTKKDHGYLFSVRIPEWNHIQNQCKKRYEKEMKTFRGYLKDLFYKHVLRETKKEGISEKMKKLGVESVQKSKNIFLKQKVEESKYEKFAEIVRVSLKDLKKKLLRLSPFLLAMKDDNVDKYIEQEEAVKELKEYWMLEKQNVVEAVKRMYALTRCDYAGVAKSDYKIRLDFGEAFYDDAVEMYVAIGEYKMVGEYDACYDGHEIRYLKMDADYKMMQRNGLYSPVIQSSVKDGDRIVSFDSLRLFQCERLLRTSRIENFRPIGAKFTLHEGVPGCGKTTAILAQVFPGDLVVTACRETKNEIEGRLSNMKRKRIKDEDGKSICVRTADSALLNERRRFRRVFVDEGLLMHPGQVFLLAANARAEEVHVFGDRKQLCFIPRVPGFEAKYLTLNHWDSVKISNLSYRCPKDVATVFSKDYDGGFYTTNTVSRSLQIKEIQSVKDLNIPEGQKILTFTQYEKEELKKNGYNNVSTIHEVQGTTFDFVHVVRLSSCLYPIYKSRNHVLVGMTRHTKGFIYWKIAREDEMSDVIRKLIDPKDAGDLKEAERRRKVTQKLISSVVVENKKSKEKCFGRFWEAVYEFEQPQRGVTARNEMVKKVAEDYVHVRGLQPMKDELLGYWNLQVLREERLSDVLCKPLVMKNDVKVELQNWYDAIFPGKGDRESRFDEIQFETNPFEIFASNVRIDMSKFFCDPYKTDRKHGYESVLTTGQPNKRMATGRQTLLALCKRNGEVPAEAVPQDAEIQAKRRCELMKKKFFRDDADEVLTRYREENFGEEERLLLNWLNNQENEKVARIDCEVLRKPFEKSLARYQLMIKTDVKNKLEKAAVGEYLAPATIVFHSPAITMMFGHVLKEMFNRFKRLLKPNVAVYLEKSIEGMGDFFDDFLHVNENYVFTEIDYSRFDRSQGEECLEFEMMMYEMLGLEQFIHSMWKYAHVKTDILNFKAGVRAFIRYQRKTGDAATAFGNTLISMVAMAESLPLNDLICVAFLGDDSLLVTREEPNLQDFSRKASYGMNLTAKAEIRKYGYFCSQFLICAQNRWRLVPDPVKRLERLGKPVDESSELALEARWLSFCELMHELQVVGTKEELKLAIDERYGECSETVSGLEAMHCVASDFKVYRNLFIRGEGFNPRLVNSTRFRVTRV